MHTTTRVPRRKHTAPSHDPAGRGRRIFTLAATLFIAVVAIGVITLPSGGGEAPPVGPPTWQQIAASTSNDINGN